MKEKDLKGRKPEIVHLYIRGNYRQDIFFDLVDFVNAWNRIWLSAEAAFVEILAVQILSNHLHICLRFRPPKGHPNPKVLEDQWLSNFVHHLRMSLSYYFNRRYDVHGSLGSRRYGSALVIDIEEDGGEDLRDLIRYILRNVTHHKITEDYRNWRYSTFKNIFGLADETSYLRGAEIPENLLKAYIPHSRNVPRDWAMTPEGLIIPPEELFPRAELERLFGSREAYLEACDTPTRREFERDAERHERRLNSAERNDGAVKDQTIIDYITDKSLVPIVSMTREQRAFAVKTIKKAFPAASIRQLSRIFHTPSSTIVFWLAR